MTMKTINVRVDEKTKREAAELYKSLGLNLSMAINVFLKQSIATGGIPFEVKKSKYQRIDNSTLKKLSDELIDEHMEAYKALAK